MYKQKFSVSICKVTVTNGQVRVIKVKLNDPNDINAALATASASGAQGNQPPRDALPVRAFAWVGRLFLMLMLIVMLTGRALADTTWVSGAVSGEWTRDGNPYIVVDSTWVPEGERLTLTAGSKVFFQQEQGLEVFGTLRVNGIDFGSRVEIRVVEGVTDWKGIRFYGMNETVWDWAEMRTPKRALLLSSRNNVTMNNCELYITGRAFRGIGEIDQNIENCNFDFNNSQIAGGMYWVLLGGSIFADESTIRFDIGDTTAMPGFEGEGTNFRLMNCSVYGGIYNNLGISIVENSRFLKPWQGAVVFAPVHGDGCRMIDSFVDGGSGAYGGNRPTLFSGNIIVGDCGFSGHDVTVSRCDIRGKVSVNGHSIIFKNSVMGRAFTIGEADSTVIDSCALIYEHPMFNSFWRQFGDNDRRDKLFVTNSILRSRSYSMGSGRYNRTALFDHNTFIINEEEGEVLFAPTINNLTTLTNNIIVNNSGGGLLGISIGSTEFSYNCVWGFDYASGAFDSVISINEIDSTNIIENPLLEWFVNMPQLSHESPCIDRGDPNFPPDPDGTRTDIGANSFYQLVREVSQLETLPLPFQFHTFPNPFNNKLQIKLETVNNEMIPIELYDMTGRRMHILNIQSNSLSTLSAINLPAGKYLLIAYFENRTISTSVNCVK